MRVISIRAFGFPALIPPLRAYNLFCMPSLPSGGRCLEVQHRIIKIN